LGDGKRWEEVSGGDGQLWGEERWRQRELKYCWGRDGWRKEVLAVSDAGGGGGVCVKVEGVLLVAKV